MNLNLRIKLEVLGLAIILLSGVAHADESSRKIDFSSSIAAANEDARQAEMGVKTTIEKKGSPQSSPTQVVNEIQVRRGLLEEGEDKIVRKRVVRVQEQKANRTIASEIQIGE